MKKQTVLQLTRRFAALAGAAVLTAVTAFSGTADAANTYSTTIGGTTTAEFSKYFVMEKGITVPSVTFKYSISAGTAVASTTGKMEVLAGVDAGNVTITGAGGSANDKQISFSSTDTAASTANSNIKAHAGASATAYNPADHQFVEKKATLDFANCKFTEPGIYRYVLTEDSTAISGVTFDADLTRIVDVYVVNDTANTGTLDLKISNIVLHEAAYDVAAGTDMGSDGTNPTGKSVGFTNWYDPAALTVEHTVSGNQASKDKYFKYTVELTGTAGTKYNVDLSGADTQSAATDATKSTNQNKTNPTSATLDSQGKATLTFYLQHGQKVVIKGLMDGDQYTVKVDKEDYKAEVNSAAYVDATGHTGTVALATTTTPSAKFVLTREGVIPTGVIMTVAPFAAIAAVGAAGIFGVTRKKKEDEE